MSGLTGNEKKRLFIPALLSAIGFAVASLAAVVVTMPSASAQVPVNPTEGNATQQTSSFSLQTNGTINAKQAAKDFLNENLNATFVDASDTAENQVANGTVVSGHLDVVQSFLVYNTTVANLDNSTVYSVFIDPSNGRVLGTSEARPLSTIGQVGENLSNAGNLTATLVDAASTAEGQFANGAAIAGSFEVMQGNPVYNITVVNVNDGMLFQVVVDPRTGSILTTSEGTPMGDLGIGGVF
ncbi:Peptidase propeptide domain-containing protein [Candidatus Nitrososphaera evergladensis SR1]|uniref:Peptidase propeptide domain-containing protein n=1 Tax=Candidatus Nitrososphaera evergladensis SR1 TaxID=1459636 RepID=A0A075MN82_9ARCH|nr:PepSY domain-containing protein [Candidatus Nitrososphaera evergladensis]AIF83001.1 Peptidase propeptide domain-containing protein [Candidatus Nitrososphaera evergladensis SR1]